MKAIGAGPDAAQLLEKFAAVQMLDVHFPTTDGRELVFRRYTQPGKDQGIYGAIEIGTPHKNAAAHHKKGQCGNNLEVQTFCNAALICSDLRVQSAQLRESLVSPSQTATKIAAPHKPAKAGTTNAQNALLSLKIIDVACGSGHMLLAAARAAAKRNKEERRGAGTRRGGRCCGRNWTPSMHAPTA